MKRVNELSQSSRVIFQTVNFHAAVKVVHTACGFLCFVTQNFHLEIYATLF